MDPDEPTERDILDDPAEIEAEVEAAQYDDDLSVYDGTYSED